MKKIALIPFLMLGCFMQVNAQSYGTFASGVFITKNGIFSGYGVSGDPANQISATPFSGNLGTFQQNSGTLALNGGETKTYKQNWANVCGSMLYYSIHPTGSSGAYNGINLPYKAGCSGGAFSDGLGGCSGNDQKWSSISYAIDLTTYCPGNYTMDIYFRLPGSNSNTYDCGDNQYVGSATNPAASVTFTIAPVPLTITGDTTLCGGQLADFTLTGCSGGSIAWSNGIPITSNNDRIIGFDGGNYTATCTPNGCTSSYSASVNVTKGAIPWNPYLTASPTDCPQGTATLTASNYSGSLSWSTGETTASVTVPAVGLYSATCSVNGCASSPAYVYVQSCSIPSDPCNILVNGSFEEASPGLNAGWQPLPQPGWFDLQPSNYNQVETWWSGFNNVPSASGDKHAELNFVDLGTLAQDVTVNPGIPLILSWSHRARAASPNEKIRVEIVDKITNQVIDTFLSSADNTWHEFSINFTAPDSLLEIRFVSLTASGDGSDRTLGNLLDNVILKYESCTNETMLKTATLPIVAASMSASPNPVTDIVSLKLTDFTSQPVSIQVTNINGTVINATKYNYVYGMNIPLDMSSLPSGMYFIKAQQGDKVAVIKIVKN